MPFALSRRFIELFSNRDHLERPNPADSTPAVYRRRRAKNEAAYPQDAKFKVGARFASMICLAATVLSACSISITDKLHPYRIDVRQGNFVTQEMAAQLKPGMTREQVRFVLGTPLLIDPFREDRWDYFYRFSPGSGPMQERRLTVFFIDNKLDRVEGDVAAADPAQPNAVEPAARSKVIEIDAAPAPAPAPVESAPQ